MSIKRIAILCLVLFVLLGDSGAGAETFSARVIPDTAFVGQYGSWQVHCRHGQQQIRKGGQIKIQFPNCWHTSPWPEGKLKDEQFSDPAANHYIGIETGKPDCEATVSIVREGVDGQHDRFGRAFVIKLTRGSLSTGDRLILKFKNTTPPMISEVQHIAMALDPRGKGNYQVISPRPRLVVMPGTPYKVQVIAPSQARVGEPVDVAVIVLDQFYNATGQYQGLVRLTTSDSTAVIPEPLKFTSSDMGIKTAAVIFNTPGIHRVHASGDQLLAPHDIESNPVRVDSSPGNANIYWGDLHSHCNNSKDGYGRIETAFHYARDVAQLDFYALTDHGAGDRYGDSGFYEGLTLQEWEQNKQVVKAYYEPGEFVSLLACEWSGRAPYGHHNIYYNGLQGLFYGEDQYTSIPVVWQFLDPATAFTIPHHTGISWPNGIGPHTHWQAAPNNEMRVAIEIYSLWGSAEYYGNSMSYEHYHQRDFGSGRGPFYARDAWMRGHYVGVVAGSDDHNSHPGREFGGLTAVYSSALDRESIFRAIEQRHTYATTGQRILMDFTINDHPMGSRFHLSSDSAARINIDVVGTAQIKFIQLMQYDGYEWSLLYDIHPDGSEFTGEFTLNDMQNSSLYYLRLQQENIIGNRKVMAWSSPIWVARSETPWWKDQE